MKQRAPIQIVGPIVSDATLKSAGTDMLMMEQYRRPELAEAATSDTVVNALRSAHDFYREGAHSILKALRMTDPTKTREGHYLDVHARGERFMDECGRRGTEATKTAKFTLDVLDREIRAATVGIETPRAAEIRAHLKSMKTEERLSFVNAAIESGDQETLSAVLSGPAYLSGLDDAQRAIMFNRHAQKVEPDKVRRRAVIDQATKINDIAFNDLLAAFTLLFPVERITDIKARLNAAREVKDGIFAT